jgi:hypothetical protein
MMMPDLYPHFFIAIPAGNAITKYPMKKALSIKADWRSVRRHAFLRCGIKMGLRLWARPHMKNRLVMIINAGINFLLVSIIAIVEILRR